VQSDLLVSPIYPAVQISESANLAWERKTAIAENGRRIVDQSRKVGFPTGIFTQVKLTKNAGG
jgi:hypothetical protein